MQAESTQTVSILLSISLSFRRPAWLFCALSAKKLIWKIWYIFSLRTVVSSRCFWQCLISMWYSQKCNIWQYFTFFAITSICLSSHTFAKQISFSSSSVEISIIAATMFLDFIFSRHYTAVAWLSLHPLKNFKDISYNREAPNYNKTLQRWTVVGNVLRMHFMTNIYDHVRFIALFSLRRKGYCMYAKHSFQIFN